MSGYGYGPPPPPPSASTGHPNYGNTAPYSRHHGGRGGGVSGGRGRGSVNGRGDYRPAPQPHYEFAAAQPYQPHNPSSYGVSHPAAAGSYPSHHQWAPEHGHQPQAHHAPSHAPVPISSSNYHPNYVPQSYPPSQYTQPPYGPPQYGNPYAPPPQSISQWSGHHGHAPHQPYGNARGRGGFGEGGGSKHHTGAPVRHGYEHEPVPSPVSGGYALPQYSHGARPPHYPPPPPQYSYAAPPPAPPPAPSRNDGHFTHNRRGRGGGHNHGGMRGRGGHHGGDKSRHQKQNHGNNSGGANKKHEKHEKNEKHVKQEKKQEPPAAGKKKKRKMNTLGLTPGMDSETEDDEGEEKTLTELIGQETLQVSDVAAFLAERRKNYPTKARVEAKKAAELAQKGEDKAASLEKQADKLRKQLRKVEFSIKRKREQGDEGDEMRDPSDDSSSDDKPETMSTRSHVAPPTPQAKKADISRHCKYYSTGGTCGKKGKCRFVHDPEVREAAMKEREANNGRLTIQQRLILNDKEQEDLTVLQSIQYLRVKGAMAAADTAKGDRSSQTVEGGEDDDKKGATNDGVPKAGKSLLPARPSSLPALPAKREPAAPRRDPPPSIIPDGESADDAQGLEHYQGWLLEPYGSTNGKPTKSDDLP